MHQDSAKNNFIYFVVDVSFSFLDLLFYSLVLLNGSDHAGALLLPEMQKVIKLIKRLENARAHMHLQDFVVIVIGLQL